MANITASLVKELREKTGAGMLDCKKALEANDANIEASIDWLREKGISKAAKKADRIAAEGLAAIKIEGNKAAVIEVNSETDFVAKNAEFTKMVDDILTAIINGEATTLEDVKKLSVNESTVEELIISKTATIGEKLDLRRVEVITKEDNESFGKYIHMGGKIAVLIVVSNASEEIANDVAMHAAAMRPTYVAKEDVKEEEVNKEREILKEQAMNEGKPANIAEKMVEGRLRKFYEEICLNEQAFVKDSDVKVGQYVANNGGTVKTMVRYEVGEGMQKREENFAEEVAKQRNQA